jgi:hypothetical protein
MPILRAAGPILGLCLCAAACRPPELCRFAGPWTAGRLRTMGRGVEFASAWHAEALASLRGAAGLPQLWVRLHHRGWHLLGRVDLDREDQLRARAPVWITASVVVGTGGEVRVLGARPGEVRIAPPRFAFDADDGFTFLQPVERWATCAAFGLSFAFRGEDTSRRERVELGLPPDPPRRHIARDAQVALAAAPGGPPFLRIGPRQYPVAAFLVEERGAERRVALQHWTGTTILGWLPAGALQAEGDEGMGGLGIGGLGGARTHTVCVAAGPLQLAAAPRGGPAEPIGWVAAGTWFVKRGARPDGTLVIAPHPRDHLQAVGEVAWLTRPAGPLRCATEAR